MTMTLFYAPTSPYARKVRVLADELGLKDVIRGEAMSVSPIEPQVDLSARNPLAKIPTLVLEDGSALYDSRVIAEYLISLVPKQTMLPPGGSERWPVLRRQALADGLLDAALLMRYEEVSRPAALRWPAWLSGQEAKLRRSVAQLEVEIDDMGAVPRLDTIAVTCALGYLDLRFARLDWRAQAPRLAAFERVFAAAAVHGCHASLSFGGPWPASSRQALIAVKARNKSCCRVLQFLGDRPMKNLVKAGTRCLIARLGASLIAADRRTFLATSVRRLNFSVAPRRTAATCSARP